MDDDYGDLHLGSGSPAIDTGTNSAISLPTDLDGNPRIVDGDGDGHATVDMGAYEYNCPAGSILYVDHTASGAGGSWVDAKPDLALGLNLVQLLPPMSARCGWPPGSTPLAPAQRQLRACCPVWRSTAALTLQRGRRVQ